MGDDSPQTLLHEAINKDRAKEVERLLKDPEVKMNVMNYRSGQPPPLVAAAKKGHVKVLEVILAHPEVDLEYPDYEGQTALLAVCKNYDRNYDETKQIQLIKMLTGKGADVNTINNSGETPLNFAIQKQSEEMVKLLLAQPSLDPNIPDNYGNTPLMKAGRERGIANIFKLLLDDERVDPNIQDKDGNCALMAAVQAGDAATVDALLKCARVNINVRDKNNYGALHHAIYNNNIGIVQTLIESKDLDWDTLDKDGMKDFWYAAQQGKTAVVKDMMKKKKPTDLDGQMAYFAAENNKSRGTMSLLKAYSKMSPQVAEQILLPAIKAKHQSVVEIVMNHIEDPNKMLDDGNTYLTLAIKNVADNRDNNARLIVYYILFNKKTDGTKCDKAGVSPYFYAMEGDNQQVKEYFMTRKFILAEQDRLAKLNKGKKDITAEFAELLRKLINNH